MQAGASETASTAAAPVEYALKPRRRSTSDKFGPKNGEALEPGQADLAGQRSDVQTQAAPRVPEFCHKVGQPSAPNKRQRAAECSKGSTTKP
jgi:hypothetical protein